MKQDFKCKANQIGNICIYIPVYKHVYIYINISNLGVCMSQALGEIIRLLNLKEIDCEIERGGASVSSVGYALCSLYKQTFKHSKHGNNLVRESTSYICRRRKSHNVCDKKSNLLRANRNCSCLSSTNEVIEHSSHLPFSSSCSVIFFYHLTTYF